MVERTERYTETFEVSEERNYYKINQGSEYCCQSLGRNSEEAFEPSGEKTAKGKLDFLVLLVERIRRSADAFEL